MDLEPVQDDTRFRDEAGFPGLQEALLAAGFYVEQRFPGGTYLCKQGTAAAVHAFVQGYSGLAKAKAVKAAMIKAEGLSRIQAVFPAIADIDELKLVTNIVQSIAPAARQLTVDMTALSQIYTAAQSALTSVQNATTIAQVRAVTPSWP